MRQSVLAKPDVEYLTENQTERAYTVLREAIYSGRMVPGTQLKEIALCQMFGLSRTAVRHAFVKLAADGLVRQIRNAGSFVRKFGLAEIIQLMQVRRALESGAAAQAAEEAGEGELADLLGLARAVEGAIDARNLQEVLQREMAFHRALVLTAHNSEMARIFDNIGAIFSTLSVDGTIQFRHGAVTHVQIVEAIASKESARAHVAVWRHLAETLEVWRQQAASARAAQESLARVESPELVSTVVRRPMPFHDRGTS